MDIQFIEFTLRNKPKSSKLKIFIFIQITSQKIE